MTVWQTIAFDNGWGNRYFLTQTIRLRALAPLNRMTPTHKARNPWLPAMDFTAATPRCFQRWKDASEMPILAAFPHRPSLPPQGSSLARERPKFRKHDSAFYLVTAVQLKRKTGPRLTWRCRYG